MKSIISIFKTGAALVWCLLVAFPVKANKDSVEIARLKILAQEAFDVSFDSCLIYANEGLALSRKTGFKKGEADMLNIIGLVYRDQSEYAKALETFAQSLAIAKEINQETLVAAVLTNKGMLYQKRGEYKLALENLLEALKIRERIGDEKPLGRVVNNIALVFTEQENYAKALEYYQKAVDLKLKGGDTLGAARTYNNMGITLVNMERFEEAISILNKAMDINERHEATAEVATNIGNLGLAFDRSGDNKKAKEYYQRCIAMQEKFPFTIDELAIPINNLGTIYLEEGNYPEAEKLLKQSLELALRNESREDIREGYGNLAQVYSRQGKFEKAFEYQQLFNAITDTLATEKSDKAMAEMIVKYETEKKEEQNKILAQQNELQKLRLERNNYIIFGLAVLIILVVISGILFYRQRRLRAEQDRIILEQKLLRSQMNPHFIFNSLQSIQGFMLTHQPAEAAGYLSDFARLVRMILENSRKEYCALDDIIRFNEYYLKMQSLRFENKFDAEIHVDPGLDTEHIVVPPMLLQPFIENSIEHGFKNKPGKGKIDVRIYRASDTLKMEVEDNGIGRIASAAMKNGDVRHNSLAMSITRERIESLNRKSRKKIKLEIVDLSNEFREPAGTKVIFDLPLKEA